MFKATSSKLQKISIDSDESNASLYCKRLHSIPSTLQILEINMEISRKSSIKLLGMLLNENLTRLDYIRAVKKKVPKNVSGLYFVH